MISSKNREPGLAAPKGRPRGFDDAEALNAAMMLFWRKGYRVTSMDDLVETMGVPRASIYQVFGDKRTLFIQCLDLYGSRFAERMKQVMATEPDGKRALGAILNASADRLTSSTGPPGCLRCEATAELMGTDTALDEALNRANTLYLRGLQKLCRRSVEDGTLTAEAAESLPLVVAAMVAGMVTLARGGATRADLTLLIDHVMRSWIEPTQLTSNAPHIGRVRRRGKRR